MSVPKHKFITWLGIQGRLRTKDKLYQYSVSVDDIYCLCLLHIETHQHLLFECYFRQQLLFTMLRWIGVECRIELCHSGLTGPQEALEDPV